MAGGPYGGSAAAANAATYAAAADAYARAAEGAAEGIAALKAEVDALREALASARGNLGGGRGGGGGGGPSKPKKTDEEIAAEKARVAKEKADKAAAVAKQKADARAVADEAKARVAAIKLMETSRRKSEQGMYREAERTRKAQESAEKKASDQRKADKKKENDVASDYAKGAKMAIGARMAGVGAGSAIDLAKLAIGMRGMAQLNAIEQRAAFNFRQMFRGIDSSPVIRAADRVSQITNRSSVTGNALEGIFTRAFNALFSKAEKAGDLIHTAFQGALLGALLLENGMLRASIALDPYINAIEDAVGPIDTFRGASAAGGIALLGLAAKAAPAAIAVGSIAAAFVALSKAMEQAKKLYDEWDENSLGQIGRKLKQDFGLTSQEEAEKEILRKAQMAKGTFKSPADIAKEKAPQEQKLASTDPAAEAGRTDGKAFAAGVVEGADSGAGEVAAAGGRLAKALDKGTRDAGGIHSPSKMSRDTARNFGPGTVEGVKDTLPQVRAAGADMANAVDGGARGAAASSSSTSGPLQVTVIHQWPAGVSNARRALVEAASEEGTWKALRAFAQARGIPVSI